MPSIIFSNNYWKLNLRQVRREDAVSFLKDAFSVKFSFITVIPTTESEVKV
jgi:hypothetical protein